MFVTILVGTFLSTLSGLGIGGGSILMLWLTLVCQLDPLTAKQINLIAFLPAALVSCLINIRRKRIRYSEILPATACGSASTVFFSVISREWNPIALRKCFGILLIAAAVREFCYNKKR